MPLQVKASRRASRQSVPDEEGIARIKQGWSDLPLCERLLALRFCDRSLVRRVYSIQKALADSEMSCYQRGLSSQGAGHQYNAAGQPVVISGLLYFQFEWPSNSVGVGVPEVLFVTNELLQDNDFFFSYLEKQLASTHRLFSTSSTLRHRSFCSVFDTKPNTWGDYERQLIQLVEMVLVKLDHTREQSTTRDTSQDGADRSPETCSAVPSPSGPDQNTHPNATKGPTTSRKAKKKAPKLTVQRSAVLGEVCRNEKPKIGLGVETKGHVELHTVQACCTSEENQLELQATVACTSNDDQLEMEVRWAQPEEKPGENYCRDDSTASLESGIQFKEEWQSQCGSTDCGSSFQHSRISSLTSECLPTAHGGEAIVGQMDDLTDQESGDETGTFGCRLLHSITQLGAKGLDGPRSLSSRCVWVSNGCTGDESKWCFSQMDGSTATRFEELACNAAIRLGVRRTFVDYDDEHLLAARQLSRKRRAQSLGSEVRW